MANLGNIIQEINTNLPDNNTQSITAKKLRDTLVYTLYGTEEDYDISANNNGTKYVDLTAALGTNAMNIPTDIRKAGMTIRFINSTTNKYEQYRYLISSITNADFTNIDNWGGVDDIPTTGSDNPVKSGGVYSTTPSIEDTDVNSDLDFSDEDGNVLMRLYDGHIKTKYFDSSDLPSGNIVDTSSKAIYTDANTLTNGQTMTLNKPNLKNHYTLSFYATINTMGTITITAGSENNWSKGRVEISPTNIVYYKYGTWEPITIQHNIDTQENISIIIKTTKVNFAEIYLLSNNSLFHQEISWNGCGDGCSLSNANGSYSNCTFSLNCPGLLKDVWIFGDSYTDTWPLCLDELGFDNYLLDGFSGRNSQQAYNSFVKDIAIAKPKAIIWMMGMNDPDSGSVNSSWKTVFDNVKTLCDTYKIEFIYATIPCVPQRDNSYKNNYAINSGVRIIPIASILGASSQGSSWYAGLLSSDNVHPSKSGSLWIALTLLNNITLLQEK